MDFNSFFDFINGKKVAFIGIGGSHIPLLKMFKDKGAYVIACDKREKEEIPKNIIEMENEGVVFRLGESYLKNLDVEIIFRTPGVRFHIPELEEARKKGIIVTSEMEVFFDLCPCKIIAITGSDGKTTTTTIISKILKKSGKKIHVGGNIGIPLLQRIESIKKEDVAVVELSSFQLISMRKSPDVAVVTNLSPNHLDMHKDMPEYIDAKKNIILHQTAFSKSILNLDNEITKDFSSLCRGELLFFSRKESVYNGSFMDHEGNIFTVNNGNKKMIMNKVEIKLAGNHNIENYLAAICAVKDDVCEKHILEIAKEFNGVEHRIEFVRDLNDVKFYNDSIASSPTRVIKGILSLYDKKIILICGGYDKKIPFDDLSEEIIKKVKLLILMGQTAKKIEEVVTNSDSYKKGNPDIINVSDMKKAVCVAKENAVAGDIISLSPACASFDMYKNFEDRGNDFKKIVFNL